MTFKEELIQILKEEVDSLKAIRGVAYEKTDIIINNQIENLEKTTKKEEELINKMARSEERRLNLLDTWGVDKGTPLSKIIEKIPEDKEDLIEIGEELVSFLEDIQHRNTVNGELINENLQWLDFNINLMTTVETPSTYGKNKDKKANKSLFDRKV